MGKIIEAKELRVDERVYLKKDMFGYRVVHPIKNENGKLNWINLLFGGWRNFFFLLAILLIIGFLMWAHYHDVNAIQQNYQTISSDPIAWCKNICSSPTSLGVPKINVSEFIINE